MEFDHNIFQSYSTLNEESNATRIASIGVRTEKLRLSKVPATTNSAVSFSELCLRFSASHDVPKVGRWVLGVPRHLHFDSPVAAYSDSRRGGRKVRSKWVRWRTKNGYISEGGSTRKWENEERESLMANKYSKNCVFNPPNSENL